MLKRCRAIDLPCFAFQLSTDDFDGPLYNATNLAVKGVAAIAAYGYIVETCTGDKAKAAEIYATAASYSNTMVEYSWLKNGTESHFIIGYFGSQGDGGDLDSWPMLYNALWLKLLGYDNLLCRTRPHSWRRQRAGTCVTSFRSMACLSIQGSCTPRMTG